MNQEIVDYIEIRLHSKIQSNDEVIHDLRKQVKKLEVYVEQTLEVLKTLTHILK